MAKTVEALNGKIGKSANRPIDQWADLPHLTGFPILPFTHPPDSPFLPFLPPIGFAIFPFLRNYRRSMRQSVNASINEPLQAPTDVAFK